MAKTIIYASGETTGSSFHLVSEWTCVYGTDGQKIRHGPTVASATYTYSLSGLPAGSRIDSATVYARVGARFTPISGTASGYPKANGIQLVPVADSDDKYQRSASLTFEDAVMAKVTFSFKAAGNTADEGYHSGSISFDDVYLAIDYTPPTSDWTVSVDSASPGDTIAGSIVPTEDNALYSHKIVVLHGNSEIYSTILAAGVTEFSIPISDDWMALFPDTEHGELFLVVETINESGSVIGVSDPVLITIICPEDACPDPGTLTISGSHLFGPLFVQGVSSVAAYASGWSGIYGSSIVNVTVAGNGKTISRDLSAATTVNQESLILETGVVKTSGAIAFTLTVTDSRGRSATVSETSYVEAYQPVSITASAQGRISSDASDADSGYIKVNYEYTPLSYTESDIVYYNTPQLVIDWGSGSMVIDGYANGSQVIFAEELLLKTSLYSLVVHVTDGITNATAVRKIGTAYAFMRWDPKNNAVGYGCYPRQDHCVEIGSDWTLIVNKEILINDPAASQLVSLQNYIVNNSGSDIIASATQPDDPVNGTIWLDIS